MVKFTLTHEINCDVDTFWKTFLDNEFNVALYTGALGFPDWKATELKDTETQITRKVSAQPKMEVPGAVAKLIGPGMRYIEDASMSKSERIWRWKMTPSTLTDKLFVGGTVRAERVSDTKCRRVAEMSVEAKIFGLGGIIEGASEKQLREGWDKSASFMNKWVETHK
jgi:hypothetical protein